MSMSVSNSNTQFISSEILSYNNYIPSSTKYNVNRHLTLHTKFKGKNMLNSYLKNNNLIKHKNNNEIINSNTKRRKSVNSFVNTSSNNPSTFETSFSNSFFDMKSLQMKNLNISNISSNKILSHLKPKSEKNKIKLDIILGCEYFLSKNVENKRKIEKFIFNYQKKFDKRMEKFITNINYSNQNIIKNKTKKNAEINLEIKNKGKIFNKFENMMIICVLILYYLNKKQKRNEAKIIYLLIIKYNMKHIKYLEESVNFQNLLTDKNFKYKINIYKYANFVLLKIYSLLIKYGFLLNLSFYGSLFLKKYLKLSHRYYLYSLAIHKNKYVSKESIKNIKIWFSSLNFNSASFSIANYLPMKIPIYFYNTALNIYNFSEEYDYDLKEKYFILNTKYNKSLLLYINGESDKAIDTLKEIKINLFAYIEDYNYVEEKNVTKFINKKQSKSFQKIFNHIILNEKNKNNTIKKLTNINLELEPLFISNTPINIEMFVNKFTNLYRIINIPNIFKFPILIKTELLMAEIELDKKHHRISYIFTNHALAIISLIKKYKNNYILNKYKEEEVYINEFLNIINNLNIKTESNFEEEEDEESEKEYSRAIKTLKNKEIELKERINFNKNILKELEKFFIFMTNLSFYQIKILNDTQPKNDKRNFLPILFEDQFRDCLSLRQNLLLNDLNIMNLSRYIILKDPFKLIIPSNLNISKEYLEKPELFKYSFINTNESRQKEEKLLDKKVNKIFKQIINSSKNGLLTLLNNNKNLVIKIIKRSNKADIKNILENPEVLKNPIEKYRKKHKNYFDINPFEIQRRKSFIINNTLFLKKNKLFEIGNEPKICLNIKKDKEKSTDNYFRKDLNLYINTENNNSSKIRPRKSLDKSNIVFRNNNLLNKENKKVKKMDSYNSNINLSLLESDTNF